MSAQPPVVPGNIDQSMSDVIDRARQAGQVGVYWQTAQPSAGCATAAGIASTVTSMHKHSSSIV